MRTLAPVMAVITAAYVALGLSIPVIPLYVHEDLGFGPFAVGVVTGTQFAAALLTRVWGGAYCDAHGGKQGIVVGLACAIASGALSLASAATAGMPMLSVALLMAGRFLQGTAGSFIITGGMNWGLALLEGPHAGKVIAWIGMAMFASLAVGAPFGTALYASGSFLATAIASVIVPIAALAMVSMLRGGRPVSTAASGRVRDVAAAVLVPGLGSALSSVGYSSILAFGSLLFSERGWQPVWVGFSAYAGALILARIVFGRLPDRFGGAQMASISLFVLVAGLAILGLATDTVTAVFGAALTGVGYSLVYPGFGAEVVRSVPPERRGVAMGLYTACNDVAQGLTTPLLGYLAGQTSVSFVFVVSAGIALTALGPGLALMRRRT
ncbi:arabinose transporter [uncultured Alsobacter sp.]|uniref:arabinose transporter n=1 Tax=uncultured Alsobacter sp. TaxID=1748258 RepID=UPI0025F2E39E|nr:arabinose transporter [uncultured Alsobacter sp.]